MNPMLVELGAMKIPRAPPVRLRIACHWGFAKNVSAVFAADCVRAAGLICVVALLCGTGLVDAAALLCPNWLPVLKLCDGCGSEPLHPIRNARQQIAPAST